jgi:uncharacterized SAM-binding protein YcdF (DUF218 family)
MSLLKILVKSLLIPPGIFIMVAMGYGGWCLARKHYLRGGAMLAMGILAWGLAIAPLADALLKPLEKGLTLPKDPTGDVVIVLDAGTNSERPDAMGKGGPSQTTLARLVAGARLSRNLQIPVLFSGRGNSLDAASTSGIVERYLIDLGIAPSRIIIENNSKNTYENAVFSTAICREKGFSQPILVTSGYHMKRAVQIFNDQDMRVLPFPLNLDTWKGKSYSWESYLPGNFQRSAIALREYLGLLYYGYIH